MNIKNKITRVSQKVAIFNQKREILALKRGKTAPSWPLCWDLPGGELEYGEDTNKSIFREIQEETGLKIKKTRLFDIISRFNHRKQFWITAFYIAKSNNLKVSLSFEHDQYKWLKLGKFIKLKTSPTNKKFLKKISKSSTWNKNLLKNVSKKVKLENP